MTNVGPPQPSWRGSRRAWIIVAAVLAAATICLLTVLAVVRSATGGPRYSGPEQLYLKQLRSAQAAQSPHEFSQRHEWPDDRELLSEGTALCDALAAYDGNLDRAERSLQFMRLMSSDQKAQLASAATHHLCRQFDNS